MSMIPIKVLFFGMLSDQVSDAEYRAEVPEGSSAADIYSRACENSSLVPLAQRPNVKVAINQELKNWDSTLSAGDEIAFLPPVTGG